MIKRSSFLALCLLAVCVPASAQRGGGYDEVIFVEEAEPAPVPPPPPPPTQTPVVVPPALQIHVSPPLRRRTPEQRRQAEAELAGFISPTLTRFSSDAEFRRYLRALRDAHREYASSGRIQFASLQDVSPEPLCGDPSQPCPSEAEGSNVMVTGSRVSPRNPSITNNQMANVEEGDIVKQIDHYLLILQDGRIFVADLNGPGRGGRELRLVDRVNVYRDRESGTWYDEMLVHGNRVLITGYSYDEGATELSVFEMDAAGHLTNQGVFHISSNDYYSSNNYATRLIGDSLLVYTPLALGDYEGDDFKIPVVRRWRPDESRDDAEERGRPLFDARSIYRPVRQFEEPTIHTVSTCPLGPVSPGRDLECRTVAMIGPETRQWSVTNTDAFLWTGGANDDDYDLEECTARARFTPGGTYPALLFRVPVSGAAPTVTGTAGMPPDQFAMEAGETRFHALLQWDRRDCRRDYGDAPNLAYVSIPLAGFSATIADQPESAYTSLPSTGSTWTVDRFTDHYLVYGGLNQYRRGLPEVDWEDYAGDPDGLARMRARLALSPAYVVPIDRPQDVRPIDIRHTMIRAERVGDDVVVTGYRDRGGLIVTYIDLDGQPGIASQTRLQGRYESEGRSHAFNSRIDPDGSGLMGLPTVRRINESSRVWWRSNASDLSFLQFDADGAASAIGELVHRFEYDERAGESGVPGYQCEVSCIDWYGNSRPIFTDGRIFGLAGAELIEGRLVEDGIREVQRLNIALESERPRR